MYLSLVNVPIKKPPRDGNRKGGREKYIKVIIARKEELWKQTDELHTCRTC